MKTFKLNTLFIAFAILCSCVQDTHLKTLKFEVNMNAVKSIVNPTVHGQFTSPSWDKGIPLTDTNNDGIYEAQVEVQAAQYSIQFKFQNNNSYELEGQNNRFVTLEYKPETILYQCEFDNPKGKQSQL